MRNFVRFGSAALIATVSLVVPAAAGGVGQCYLRADTGYSWPTNSDASADQYFVHGPVTATTLDSTWFVEAGLGCSWLRQTTVGSIKDVSVVVTSSGLRGEVAVGYRGRRNFHGVPPNPILPEDPVNTGVSTVTVMGNVYYDFAPIHRFTPYVGMGIGAAFHDVDQVTFHDANVTFLPAHRQTEFAWQLMTGITTDVGSGVLLDVGYRYIDLGGVNSSVPSIGHSLNIDDLEAHEIRVGLRVPLGLR